MLHYINENSELKGRRFPVGTNLQKHLEDTLANYKGNKSCEGFKRLRFLISMADQGGIRYEEMKRLKNWFDTHQLAKQTEEYKLNGGEEMRMWVDMTLSAATKAVKDWKQARKDAGEKNAFIKPHEKDRQNRRKNRPSMSKIKTDDASKSVYNGKSVRYESRDRKIFNITENQLRLLIEAIKKERKKIT